MFVASLIVVGSVANAEPAYPIKSSANGRYLVDASGQPFLLVGDSPQALMVNLSEAETEQYFINRRTNGFNAALVDIIATTYTGGRSDSSTYDGILPFTANVSGHSTYDLTKTNATYWLRVDDYMTIAATNGIIVFLDPIETGGYLRDTSTFQDNGSNNCYSYGQFLGDRYKGYTNIVWFHGNDYDYHTYTASGDQYVIAVAKGILSKDTNHLQTIEFGAEQDSGIDSTWTGTIDLNAAYSWSPTYAQMLTAYSRSPILPVFMAEDHYEEEAVGSPPEANNSETGTPFVLRKQNYWTMLSGGTGKLYGDHYIWAFLSGWQSHLDTTGVHELGLWKHFFCALPWYNLVPDTNHAIVNSGYGAYSTNGLVSTNDYATAAWITNGTLAVIYFPTNNNITVNLSKFAGPVKAQWFDPTSGSYSTATGSSFPNAGMQTFTPAGNNNAGDTDWILLLETALVIVQPQIIAAEFSNSDFVITFNTALGQTYELQSATNLTNNSWLPIVTNIREPAVPSKSPIPTLSVEASGIIA